MTSIIQVACGYMRQYLGEETKGGRQEKQKWTDECSSQKAPLPLLFHFYWQLFDVFFPVSDISLCLLKIHFLLSHLSLFELIVQKY